MLVTAMRARVASPFCSTRLRPTDHTGLALRSLDGLEKVCAAAARLQIGCILTKFNQVRSRASSGLADRRPTCSPMATDAA